MAYTEDLAYQKGMALDALRELLDNLETIKDAAERAQQAVQTDNGAALTEAMREISDHVDGYWHKVVLSGDVGEIGQFEDLLATDREEYDAPYIAE